MKKQPAALTTFAEEYEARVRELSAREGTLPCSEVGCSAGTGIACEYVDRRGRQCRTAWCPEHRVIVEEHIYCRRHSGVVSALPTAESSLVVPRPDIDNRAPSLAGWMARQLDADVWRLLLDEMDAQQGGQLVADPVTLVFTGMERRRAWERTWKVLSHGGPNRRVSLVVEEDNQDEVLAKVGLEVVERGVPPWIVHRQHGERVPPDEDARERAEFNQKLLTAIEAALLRERQEIAEP